MRILYDTYAMAGSEKPQENTTTEKKTETANERLEALMQNPLSALAGLVTGRLDLSKLWDDVIASLSHKKDEDKSKDSGSEKRQDVAEKVDETKILSEASSVIKNFEGFHKKAYWDYQQYSIGYGTKANGPEDTITQEGAQKELEARLKNEFLPGVQRIPHWNEMKPEMQVALLSFAYNVGANFYGQVGTEGLTSLLRNKEWDKVPAKMKEYNKAGGKTLQGLVTRRNEEASLWEKGRSQLA